MDPQTFEAIKARYKLPGWDIDLNRARASFKYFQFKEDGWWSVLELKSNIARVWSVSNSLSFIYDLNIKADHTTYLIGEFLYGTNRAVNNSATYQTFHAFDVATETQDYIYRYNLMHGIVSTLNHSAISAVDLYPISLLEWGEHHMREHNIEGLVFRNDHSDTRIARYKPLFTQDYICMGFTEGRGKYEGMLGAIVGGKIIRGKLTQVISVGGGFLDRDRIQIWQQRNELLGRVFEAEGRQLFESGSLRHPTFLRWREDKLPEEVVW